MKARKILSNVIFEIGEGEDYCNIIEAFDK